MRGNLGAGGLVAGVAAGGADRLGRRHPSRLGPPVNPHRYPTMQRAAAARPRPDHALWPGCGVIRIRREFSLTCH